MEVQLARCIRPFHVWKRIFIVVSSCESFSSLALFVQRAAHAFIGHLSGYQAALWQIRTDASPAQVVTNAKVCSILMRLRCEHMSFNCGGCAHALYAGRSARPRPTRSYIANGRPMIPNLRPSRSGAFPLQMMTTILARAGNRPKPRNKWNWYPLLSVVVCFASTSSMYQHLSNNSLATDRTCACGGLLSVFSGHEPRVFRPPPHQLDDRPGRNRHIVRCGRHRNWS